MKSALVFLCLMLLATNCSEKGTEIVKQEPTVKKLLSEEYFTQDAAAGSSDGFLPSLKKVYQFDDKNNLTAIYSYEFDPQTHNYGNGFKSDEFYYDVAGQLIRSIEFLDNGIQWIESYEYLTSERTKVTRYESINGTVNPSTDWWIMDRTPSSFSVKYYQLNNQLYQELACDIDHAGNITRITSNPSLSVGTIYYTYDNSPNPYQFRILAGKFFSAPKYFSANNVVAVTTENSSSFSIDLEYNESGYPSKIVMGSSKRVFEYQ